MRRHRIMTVMEAMFGAFSKLNVEWGAGLSASRREARNQRATPGREARMRREKSGS